MYRMWGRLALVLLLPMCAAAQSASTNEREQEMQEMRARIERLEKLVAELQKEKESRNGVATAQAVGEPIPPPSAPAAPSSQHEDTVASMDHSGGQGGASSATERKFPALHFRGFGDVDFAATDDKTTHSGFNMGQFILHISSPLSEKVSVFGETSFTAQTTPTATVYNVDVERLLIRYDYNDFFKLSFGRYHTPINYWNTTFHHGAWLQTTISRPEMTQFGGSFIPVHFIGSLVEGSVPAGGLNLNYNAGVGNGRASVISRGGDFGEVNDNRAWLVTVVGGPGRLFGLQG